MAQPRPRGLRGRRYPVGTQPTTLSPQPAALQRRCQHVSALCVLLAFLFFLFNISHSRRPNLPDLARQRKMHSLPWSVDNLVLDSSKRALFGDVIVPHGGISGGSLYNRKRVLAVMHPNWVGVREATLSMGIPAIQTTNVETEAFLSELIEFIMEARIDTILIGGLPPGFSTMACVVHVVSQGQSTSRCGIAQKLRNRPLRFKKNVQVMAIYHGSPALHVNNPGEVESFDMLLAATKKGYISRVGVLKHGFMQTLLAMGVPAFPVSNFLVPTEGALRGPSRSAFNKQFHVGVLGGTTTMKNVMTQIAAACSLGPQVTIHALESHRGPGHAKYTEINCPARIVWHPRKMEHEVFVSLLGQMDVNMYVSFTECQPMVVLESIQQGVPALLSDTTALFTETKGGKSTKMWPLLEDLFVCRQTDNPDSIRMCLMRLREILTGNSKSVLLQQLHKRMKQFIDEFNPNAEKLLNLMLHGKPARYFSDDRHHTFIDSLNLPSSNRANMLAPKTSCNSFPDGAPANKWLSSPQSLAWNSKVIVFCTYEMGGVNAGGMGVFLDALIHTLLSTTKMRIIVLYDNMPEDAMLAWRRSTLRLSRIKDEQQLKIAHLQTIAKGFCLRCGADTSDKRPIGAWEMALLWERGITKLYHHPNYGPFDAVEFFEYFGPATELLLRRAQQIVGEEIPGSLPPSVAIIVRVHGSISFINAVENAPMTEENFLISTMERLGLAAADTVLYPSKELRVFYEKQFDLHSRHVAYAPPPMESVLAAMFEGVQVSAEPRWNAATKRDLLVYGKLQDTKGVFIILDVMIQLFKSHAHVGREKSGLTHVHFYGIDMFGTRNMLRRMIPVRLQGRFHFHAPISRQRLPELVTHFRAALFATQFESFCLSAHELHFLRMPLVVPSTFAFSSFTESTTFRWNFGDKKSLRAAISQAMRDDEGLRARQKAPRISYGNPLDGYRSIFNERSAEKHEVAPEVTKDYCKLQRSLQQKLHDWQRRSNKGYLVTVGWQMHIAVSATLLGVVVWLLWRPKCLSLLHLMYIRSRKKRSPAECV